jgi:hypothetical protein
MMNDDWFCCFARSLACLTFYNLVWIDLNRRAQGEMTLPPKLIVGWATDIFEVRMLLLQPSIFGS